MQTILFQTFSDLACFATKLTFNILVLVSIEIVWKTPEIDWWKLVKIYGKCPILLDYYEKKLAEIKDIMIILVGFLKEFLQQYKYGY